MAIYDTEEEQLEQLKKWWESNQSSVLAGIVGAVVIVAAFSFWQGYREQTRTEASQMYAQLLESAANNNTESVEKMADMLISQQGSSAYAHYAALQLAKVKVEKGDLEAARAVLEKELKESGSPELRNVCRLRLIQLMLAEKKYEDGLKLISEVDPSETEGFSAGYDELQGDLYVAMDRLDEARAAYQSALRNRGGSPLIQYKLDDIAAPAFPESALK